MALFLSFSRLMDRVPWGPALISVQRWGQKHGEKIYRKRKTSSTRRPREECGLKQRVGCECEGGKVALEHLPMVETLTDGLGSLSKSPRRDSSRSSYTQSWNRHPQTHKHTHSREDRGWNHTLSTRDCACNANEVHLNSCRPIQHRKRRMKRTERREGSAHRLKGDRKVMTACGVHNWASTEVKPWRYHLDKKNLPRHSTSSMDWLVSEGAVQRACYLVQTRNHYLAAVGTDVHVQIKPLPRLGAGLENKARDGRVLGIRKGPLQNNTCCTAISQQRHGGLWSVSPQWRVWCRGNKKHHREMKSQWRKLPPSPMLSLERARRAKVRLMLFFCYPTKPEI